MKQSEQANNLLALFGLFSLFLGLYLNSCCNKQRKVITANL